MSIYESLKRGLNEAIEYSQNGTSAKTATLTIPDEQISSGMHFNAEDIATWFISEFNKKDDVITNMKLQKLLYYAQGLSIKYNGCTLFDDAFEKWKYGPVIPDIYKKYSDFGRDPIIENAVPVAFSENVQALLEDVMEEYGQYSAWKLSEMSHDEKPWKNTLQNEQIANSLMFEQFAR